MYCYNCLFYKVSQKNDELHKSSFQDNLINCIYISVTIMTILDPIEVLIMLELQKKLAHEQAEEQKNILDTILAGAQKAAQVVTNIQSIAGGNDPKPVEPLYKEPAMRKPIEPPMPLIDIDTEEPCLLAKSLERITETRLKTANVKKLLMSLMQSNPQGAAVMAVVKAIESELFEINNHIYDFYQKK